MKKYIIFIFGLIVVLWFLLPIITEQKINPSDNYFLSEQEVNRLQKLADEKNDSDAAFRLALFYERSSHDFEKMKFWLERAASLGNKSARRILLSLREHSLIPESKSTPESDTR